jgi:hypothetical protein
MWRHPETLLQKTRVCLRVCVCVCVCVVCVVLCVCVCVCACVVCARVLCVRVCCVCVCVLCCVLCCVCACVLCVLCVFCVCVCGELKLHNLYSSPNDTGTAHRPVLPIRHYRHSAQGLLYSYDLRRNKREKKIKTNQ